MSKHLGEREGLPIGNTMYFAEGAYYIQCGFGAEMTRLRVVVEGEVWKAEAQIYGKAGAITVHVTTLRVR